MRRAAAALALAALAACDRVGEERISARSTYSLLEVRPVRGRVESAYGAPRPVRILALRLAPESPRGRAFAAGGVPANRGSLAARSLRPGRLVLDDHHLTAFAVDPAWRVGEARRERGPSLVFADASGRVALRVLGTAAAPAEVEIRLLKQCPAAVFHVTGREARTRAVGVFSLPAGAEPREWVEAAPPCYAPSDHEADLLPAAEPRGVDTARTGAAAGPPRRHLVIQHQFWTDLLFRVQEDPRIAERLIRLAEEARRAPFRGTEKPEPLKGELRGCWSRRIAAEHRFVCRVTADAVDCLRARYHHGRTAPWVDRMARLGDIDSCDNGNADSRVQRDLDATVQIPFFVVATPAAGGASNPRNTGGR